jgi:hypothetical protein
VSGEARWLIALCALAPPLAVSSAVARPPQATDPSEFAPSRADFLAFAADTLPQLQPTDQLAGGPRRPLLGLPGSPHPDSPALPKLPDPDMCLIVSEWCPARPCAQFVKAERARRGTRCDRYPSATPRLRPAH